MLKQGQKISCPNLTHLQTPTMEKKKPNIQKIQTPELLLPAGSREAFAAAVEGGADAVYLGLEKFNARNRAKNFRLEDLPPILEVAHKNHVKVYLTLNTLLKNAEIKSFLEIVQFLEAFQPDAIIVQDWGVFHLLHKLLKVPLHGSTQMGTHNSMGVQFGERAGLSRIIMARELTLPELQEIQRVSHIELEIFTHGALCYSFSGGCLFSSYAGGMSANRGQCRQPCRRLYSEEDSTKYWFNLKDLQLLEMIPQLLRIGVRSFKIEGRMKRADYVYAVAKAYRLAIDYSERMDEAKAILDKALNRETTSYFMQNPIAENIAEFPYTGLPVGKIVKAAKEMVTISLLQSIHKGDTLRILPHTGEDRQVFTINDMTLNEMKVQSANAGDVISISANGIGLIGGETVFLTDKSSFKPSLQIPYRKPIHPKPLASKYKQAAEQLCRTREFSVKKGLYIRIDDLAWLQFIRDNSYREIFIPLSLAEENQSNKPTSVFRIELPRFIPEKQLPEIKILIHRLINSGNNRYMVSHISQILLFPKDPKLDIWINEWVYTLNDAAINFFADNQVKGFVYPLENDIPNLLQYKNKNGIVPLFFHPQLFYSRQPVHLKRKFSEADKQYRILKRHGWTVVIPEEPVSVLHLRSKLEERGYSRFLVDLSFMEPSADILNEVVKSYEQGLKWKTGSAFNYKKGLW